MVDCSENIECVEDGYRSEDEVGVGDDPENEVFSPAFKRHKIDPGRGF